MEIFKPSISCEEYSELKLNSTNIVVIPSKFREYTQKLNEEISSHFKLNKRLIQIIEKKIFLDTLNKKNDGTFYFQNQENNYLSFFYYNSWYSADTVNFSNSTQNHIKKFFKRAESTQLNFQQSYYPDAKIKNNNQYFIFIHGILNFYLFKNKVLIEFVKRNLNKLNKINNLINKFVNFVSFLKQSNNKIEIKKYNSNQLQNNEANKIFLNYYKEIKELRFTYELKIGNIINYHDFKEAILSIYNENNKTFIKNDFLRFIFHISKFSDGDYNYIENSVKTIENINERKLDINKIEQIISQIEIKKDYVIDRQYDLSFYSHRQKIINDNFHHLRNLYNELKDIVGDKIDDVINHLLLNKFIGLNREIIDFLIKIAKTETKDLIHL